MQEAGYFSKTVMSDFYSINKKEDFDEYLYDIISPLYLRPFVYLKKIFPNVSNLHWIFYVAKNFDILHITYQGAIFKDSVFWKEELLFYKKMGLKIVALPYGSDYQRYSKLYSKSWHHVLLINYPLNAKKEKLINEKIEFVCEYADCVMSGFQYDQVGRWDILPYAIYPLDCEIWKQKQVFSNKDGLNGIVKVYHTPNHKGIKGTEFLIEAIESLKSEGLLVELVLLENVNNDKVRKLLFEDADILVEQLILGYALSAIEGMACGLPVISNLEEEIYTRVFRRYSYLNECPIVSSSPERIKQDLKMLITIPALRQELGIAGRAYAEKYHSYKAMADIFNAIYDKVWYNLPMDLINFFNPQNKLSYNNRSKRIEHPLFDNKITNDTLEIFYKQNNN
jgi:glycosyltransferase involved in cell wall biosynthesis